MWNPDIVHEVCKYLLLKELKPILCVNCVFNTEAQKHINNIVEGRINPDDYFNHYDYNGLDFDYPRNSFHDNEGCWDVNNQPVEEPDQYIFTGVFDKVYYYQIGSNAGDDWVVFGRVENKYVYFKASCDFTGFDCAGGGSYNYHTDWVTLWNMYVDDRERKLMLKHFGHNMFKIRSMICY